MRPRGGHRHCLTFVAFAVALLVAALVAAAASAATPTPSPASPSAAPLPGSGAALFAQNCSGCHGARGEGGYGPPLAADAFPSLVAGMVARGGAMPGAGNLAMPPFRRQFSDAQIAAVASYVATSIADPAARAGNVNEGGDLYRLYCSGCHSATSRGGALSQGPNAPVLADFPAAMSIAATLYGPGNMPLFAPSVFDVRQQASVALYVQVLERPPSPGGHGLGWLGPVSEGFAALGGLLILLALTVWLAWGKSRQAPLLDPTGAHAGSHDTALSTGDASGD